MTPEFILQVIQKRLQEEASSLMEQAKKELEKRTPEIVAGVAVELMKHVSMEDHTTHFVFRIEKRP